MRIPKGLFYDPNFLLPNARAAILRWLATIHPLWEQRYSENHPPPAGETQRGLLRPVYWLGNWQFACLDYYRPPKGTYNRCVRAEPYPPVLQKIVLRVERLARKLYRGADMPDGWRLNTCLVNLYGSRWDGKKWTDSARVGEHKDFEPGPVASLSMGERAMFQFVRSRSPGAPASVVFQQWLDDGSLQLFGGEKWKEKVFHRVQRVDRRSGHHFPPEVRGFQTRRVNFTFRFVPDAHVVRFARLPAGSREDIRPYVEELAHHASFFRRELEQENEKKIEKKP